MVTVSLVLALSMLVTAVQGAPSPPAVQLLAFSCVDLDSGDPAVVELEREAFPPFTDTGLFFANGQVIAYVEQGSLTIFGDQLGRALGDVGFSAVAGADSSLGVRNDGLTAASVLWARVVPAADQSQAAMSITALLPSVEQSLSAPVPTDEEPILPALFFEFELPESVTNLKQAHLFLVRMELAPAAGFDPDGDEALMTTGSVGMVVESGTVLVDQVENEEPITQTLHPGEGMTVDGTSAYTVTPAEAESAATVFLIGVIATDDAGRVGTEIANAPTRDRLCSASSAGRGADPPRGPVGA
jgi:hypothetical protein